MLPKCAGIAPDTPDWSGSIGSVENDYCRIEYSHGVELVKQK